MLYKKTTQMHIWTVIYMLMTKREGATWAIMATDYRVSATVYRDFTRRFLPQTLPNSN
jgi:hypothetical protein